jgi:hypothetical protein
MDAADGERSTRDADEKVLRNYMLPDGSLKEIPRKLNRKRVVYEHITQKFESGRRYSEADVNAILQRFHSDYATIRRDLIELGFMTREAGQYWRLA